MSTASKAESSIANLGVRHTEAASEVDSEQADFFLIQLNFLKNNSLEQLSPLGLLLIK